MTDQNYLTLDLHWAAVVELLGQAAGHRLSPSTFRVRCVDVEFLGNGDVVGEGTTTLDIARINFNHFVPLFHQHGPPIDEPW